MTKIFSRKGMALFIAAFIAILLVSACQPSGTPTLSPEQIAQSVASTQQAAATQQFVETLIARLDELTNQPTWTPLPTYTPYQPRRIRQRLRRSWEQLHHYLPKSMAVNATRWSFWGM